MYKFPFLLVFSGLATGMIFLPAGIGPLQPWLVPLCLFPCILLLMLMLRRVHGLNGLKAFIIWVYFIGYGYSLKQVRLDQVRVLPPSGYSYYQGMVRQKAERRQSSWCVETEVIAKGTVKTARWNFKAYLYFPLQADIQNIQPGDRLIFYTRLRPVKSAGGKEEFDYQKYLMFKGISATGFIGGGDFLIEKRKEPPFFLSALREGTAKLIKSQFKPAHASMLQALLMGRRGELESDLKERYQAAGIVHVLALSGLHAGIILLFIRFIFSFCPSVRGSRLFEAILSVLLLWFYALFAGLPASMLRTAIMFSLLAVGRTMNRQYSGINAVFASASFLIIIDPFMLYRLGFQLSHLAVLGILVMYRPLFMLVRTRFWAFRYLWGLSSLSISAQIMVAPLIAYHFGKLPVYFLPANLLAVPLVTLLLLSGLLFLCTTWSELLQDFFAVFLGYLLDALNGIAATVDGLPGNSIFIAKPGIMDIIFIYMLIVLIWDLIFRPGKKMLWLILLLIMGWMISGTIREVNKRIFRYSQEQSL